MKLFVFRGRHSNFGDELNHWLLPKVFPNFFDDDASSLFLGIGSNMWSTHPAHCRKVVFGSGYAGYTPVPKIDKSWLVYCVRGPRTADICGLSRDKVAGDSAIIINRYRERAPKPPKRAIAFMPHWESPERGYWEEACRLAGIRFIDPRRPVDEVLEGIEASTTLITEAMHGAIVADALRVPWIPVMPIAVAHRFKWFDWAEALDLTLSPHSLWPSSTQEMVMVSAQRIGPDNFRASLPVRASVKFAKATIGIKRLDDALTRLAAARLWNLARVEPVLSSDAALDRVLDRLESSADRIKKDLSKR